MTDPPPPMATEPSPEAPIYVAAYDLARLVLERTVQFPRNQRFVLARRMEEAALDLLDAITVALYHPRLRADRLLAADAALTRLRVSTRLARDLQVLAVKAALELGRRMAEVGQQLGGWQKKLGG